jgi:hypothetical protein
LSGRLGSPLGAGLPDDGLFATAGDARSADREVHFVDTCFSTHHLQFAYDDDNTLWTSGDRQVVGWLNTKIFDETGDAAKAQG